MRASRVRFRVLAMLFLFSTVTYLDRVCISSVKTPMSAELGLSNAEMGLVFSSFTLAYGLFEIPAGWLGDRFGPRMVIAQIVFWWSALTGLTGVVRNYTALLGVRFAFGALQAGAYPNATCVIRRWFPAEERGRAQGVVWMAASVGGALAPFIVTPILRGYGWRAVFYLFTVFGVLWVAAWYAWFRDNPSEKSGVNEAELRLIGPPVPAKPHGNLLRMARGRNMWAIMAMYHISCYGSYWFIFWLPSYLLESKGLEDFAPYAAAPFVLGAMANYLGGYSTDRLVQRFGLKFGRRVIGLAGGVGAAICVLGAIYIENLMVAMLMLAIGYSAISFALPNSWAVCLDVGRDYVGTVSGAMNTAGQLGGTVALAAIGYAIDAWGWDAPLYGVAAAYFTGALFWLWIAPTEPVIPESSEA